jgi:cytoskeletal protein CcmA (bactofilin family)
LHSTCQVLVRGVVDGDLKAPTVIVSETGTVIGNVKADCIRSEGVLAGRVDANDVYLSGNVRSDTVIRAKTLEVKLQRKSDKLEVTFGECILDVGDDPGATAHDAAQTKAQDAAQPQPQEARPARTSTMRPPAPETGDSKASENGKREGSSDEAGSKDRRSVPPPPS